MSTDKFPSNLVSTTSLVSDHSHCVPFGIQKVSVKAQDPTPRQLNFQAFEKSNAKGSTSASSGTRRIPAIQQRRTVRGYPKTLSLPKLCKLDNISAVLIVRRECPWDTYRRAMTCDIGGKVIIASHRSNPSRLRAIREYPVSDAQKLIRRFELLNHTNILSTQDCYIDGHSLYAFVEDISLSVGHLVACQNIYPTEIELGSILSQVLEGMRYLSSFGLSHRSLSCNEILLGLDGTIKIASLDKCVEGSATESEARYIAALPSITMALMQEHEKDDGITGVDDIGRWPVDSGAFAFLSAISSTGSIGSLKQHTLIATKRRPAADLVMLVRVVLLAAEITYSYEFAS